MKLPFTTFLLAEITLAFAAVQWPLASHSTKGIHNEYPDRSAAGGLKKTTADGWQLKMGSVWDVLGPFPQGAREQHFLSPSYPLDLSNGWNVDFQQTYPSSLQDEGMVGWSSLTATGKSLDVMFPNVRWNELRSTEGWSSLQHHAVLHTELVLTPPAKTNDTAPIPHSLVANVRQASFFALIPADLPANYTPSWHSGNIYDLANSPTHVVELPISPSFDHPTTYHLIVSGDYEVRLFGDPIDVNDQETPIQRLHIDLGFEHSPDLAVVVENQLNVVPDILDGWILSENGAIGVGVRSLDGWWEATSVESASEGIAAKLLHSSIRLAPSQSQSIPITLIQLQPYQGNSVSLSLTLRAVTALNGARSALRSSKLEITLPMQRKDSQKFDRGDQVLKAAYFLGKTPFAFTVKPPTSPSNTTPPIIALHGAGVEFDNPDWTGSIPAQHSNWIIFPSGRTSWGFDWHGPSALELWSAYDALRNILESHEEWQDWSIHAGKVILIGHSNGGQGVWYQAERWPDQVVAAVPASAYIKSQLYVSTDHSRGSHFLDTSLRGILENTLQVDDNDIYATNLVSIPLLSVHGGRDRNVPTWHSRELVSNLKAWYPSSNVSYYEVHGMPHWWNAVLSNARVQSFLNYATAIPAESTAIPDSFVLTTSVPDEQGSLHGLRIAELEIPGRLGRLHVKLDKNKNTTFIRTTNVFKISLSTYQGWPGSTFNIDGRIFEIDLNKSIIWFTKQRGHWNIISDPPPSRSMGPLHRILVTSDPLVIVVPEADQYLLSVATRIAHSLFSYLRIDAQIYYDYEAIDLLGNEDTNCSNLVVLGGSANTFGQLIMSGHPGGILFTEKGWKVQGHVFDSPGLGVAFLHSHPTCWNSVTLFMSATDAAGFERILRLHPLRTGVPVPEWVITGPKSDFMGAGGLLGAGYWGRFWEWNSAESWIGGDW